MSTGQIRQNQRQCSNSYTCARAINQMAIIMANPLTNPDRFFAELSGRDPNYAELRAGTSVPSRASEDR